MTDYKDENTWLMFGDCIERLKCIEDRSIDLVLTDPPYNIARSNNFNTMGRAGIDFGEWDKGADIFTYIEDVSRVLKKNGSFVVFNAWRNLGAIADCAESLGFDTKDMIRLEKQTRCQETGIVGTSQILSAQSGLQRKGRSGHLIAKMKNTKDLSS